MLYLFLGSLAVTGSLLTIWWTMAGSKRAPQAVTRNLTAGLALGTDLRAINLSRSGGERVLTPTVERIAQLARRLTPAGGLEAMEHRLLLAGAPAGWSIERILAARIVGAVVGALLGGLRVASDLSLLNVGLWLAITLFGYWLPNLLLINMAQKRTAAIMKRLPDTLDQLTICVEAGLGFDAALARSCRTDRGPLAEEIQRTLQDVQAGMSRRDALRRLEDRVQLPEMKSFVNAVVQAEQYGLPMATVLRVQSTEQRTKRRQRAEERAAKLPVKLVFPTVLFIFPALFIVLLGPAALQIFRTFAG